MSTLVRRRGNLTITPTDVPGVDRVTGEGGAYLGKITKHADDCWEARVGHVITSHASMQSAVRAFDRTADELVTRPLDLAVTVLGSVAFLAAIMWLARFVAEVIL